MKLVGKSDGQIVIGNKNYSIIGVSVEKKGYLNITCRLDNTTSFLIMLMKFIGEKLDLLIGKVKLMILYTTVKV